MAGELKMSFGGCIDDYDVSTNPSLSSSEPPLSIEAIYGMYVPSADVARLRCNEDNAIYASIFCAIGTEISVANEFGRHETSIRSTWPEKYMKPVVSELERLGYKVNVKKPEPEDWNDTIKIEW